MFVKSGRMFIEYYNVNMHHKVTFHCYKLLYFPQRYYAIANRKQQIFMIPDDRATGIAQLRMEGNLSIRQSSYYNAVHTMDLSEKFAVCESKGEGQGVSHRNLGYLQSLQSRCVELIRSHIIPRNDVFSSHKCGHCIADHQGFVIVS